MLRVVLKSSIFMIIYGFTKIDLFTVPSYGRRGDTQYIKGKPVIRFGYKL